MKKLLFIFAFSFLISPSWARAEVIQNYHTVVRVNQDGSANIEEDIVWDFEDEYHHGIQRFIPVNYKNAYGKFKLRISNIFVTDSQGTPQQFSTSSSNGQLNIKIGDPDKTITGVHTYRILYKADRAIRYFNDHDELYWNLIGTGWDVAINQAGGHVELPGGEPIKTLCFTGAQDSTESNCDIESGNNSVAVKAQDSLFPHEGLTIGVFLNKGVIAEPTTAETIRYLIEDNWPIALPFIIAPFMFWLWRKYGKDPKGKGTIVPQYDTPQGLDAISINALRYNGVNSKGVSAAILDLATKGSLKITRTEVKKFGLFTSEDYKLTKLATPPESLSNATKAIFEALFADGNEVNVSDLKTDITFGKSIRTAQRQALTDLVKAKYYPRDPKTLQIIFIILSIGIGIWGTIFLSVGYGPVGTVSGIVSAIIIFIFAWLLPARTKFGVEALEYIKGLASYIGVAEKDRIEFHNAPEKNPQLFEKLLPAAIALGLEKNWAEKFQDILKNDPSWYSGPHGTAFNAVIFSNSIGEMSSSFATTASASSSSSSGGSGGGFGGGGGGSW